MKGTKKVNFTVLSTSSICTPCYVVITHMNWTSDTVGIHTNTLSTNVSEPSATQ